MVLGDTSHYYNPFLAVNYEPCSLANVGRIYILLVSPWHLTAFNDCDSLSKHAFMCLRVCLNCLTALFIIDKMLPHIVVAVNCWLQYNACDIENILIMWHHLALFKGYQVIQFYSNEF